MSAARAGPRSRDASLWRALATLGAGLLLASCGRDPSTAAPRLALNRLALPHLHCGAAPEQRGECTRDADCASPQRCTLDAEAAPSDRGPLTLRCAPPAGAGPARARCSSGDECQSGLCALAGVCVAPCSADHDCALGQLCQPLEVRLGEDALAKLQACARTAAFAPDVSLQVTPLGELPPQRLTSLPLASPGAAEASALLVLAVDCASVLQPERLVQVADGRVLFDLARQLDGVVQLNPSVNAGSLVPLLLPDNPRLRLSAQGYELGVTVDAAGPASLISATRTARGGTLDLNVFYVGGGSALTPDGLHPGDARFAEVLARLGARYEQIGLRLGEVREYDVVGALRAQLGALEVAGSEAQPAALELPRLGELFALSAGVEDGGINLFLVRGLGSLRGIAGGTPGALGLHGTPASGVAVALDTVGLERADVAIFHELSHQMGLFHTSEIDGSTIEPLSDTPNCPVDLDLDHDGVLRADECSARDGDNLMFWEAAGDGLSAQQIEILRGAPVLR